MSNSKPRPRKTPKNTYTTSSGKTIKLNRSLGDRMKANKEAKAQRKAAYLSTLPKERWISKEEYSEHGPSIVHKKC